MKTKDRILALALAVCLLLGMTPYIPGPVAVHAESGCNHVHNEDCGYGSGAPCEHDHDEDCGEGGEDCAHIHDEDCGYIEAVPCTHTHDEDCGGLADSDNGPALGESGPATPTQIAAFAPLDDTVRVQGFDLGDVTLADLVLPETLEATDEDDAPLTVERVTWACTDPDTGFDAAADGLYTFTPELPGGYTLADGVALPEITVIVRPDGPAIMPMNLNTDLAVGTWTGTDGHRWVEFGGILWRVLEVKDNDPDASGNRTALLLAEEAVDSRQFHNNSSAGSGNWLTSDIRAWLNDDTSGFLSEFSPDEQAAIVTTTNYTLGGSNDYSGNGYTANTTDSSKVFLLSVDEANDSRYFDDVDHSDRSIGAYWWLRSPGGSSSRVAHVYDDGVVHPAGNRVDIAMRIHPALKINLASSIFTSENPLYEVKVTVVSGGSPVAGARVSFSGASAPVAKFSNANGEAIFHVLNGTYDITASLLGYEDTVQVTVNNSSAIATIDLNLNTEGLPFYIRFGQSGGTPLKWRLVDLEKSVPEALLLSEDYLMDGNWLAVHNWINEAGNGSGGFLEEGEYFTAAELDAMTIYSETTTKMFLLSSDEVERYFPLEAMRYFPSGSTSDYWLRSGDGSGSYDIVNKDNGNVWTISETNTFDARPAVWVDLTRLVQWDDSGDVTLVPAYAATVEVKAAGGQSINGANVTLTLTSGETYRMWDGAALDLDGMTSSGSAAFTLPVGTYEVTATATGYTQQSGPFTLTVNGNGDTTTVYMDDTQKPSVVSVTPSGSGAAVSGNIVVTFDEAMNTGTGSVTLTPNGGSPQALIGGSWNNTIPANTIYSIPYTGLANSTTYTIGITGFTDVAGNPMNATGPHTFTTVALGQAATPMASPPGGAYTAAQSVTLTSTTTGAAIYYTLDGSDPTVTTNSARTLYAAPINVPLGATLKAYATAQGWTDSAVMEEVYTQAATYTLTVINGTGDGSYAANEQVPISAAIPTGATFTGWTSNAGGAFANANNKNTTFTMPATNVTITATYSSGGDGGGNPDPSPTLKLGGIDTDTVTIGTNYNITVATTYTGNKTLTYSISGNLPTGMSFNTATGGISGTPATSTEGDYPFTITVKEQNGSLSDSRRFTLTVQSAPVTPAPAILRIATPPDDTIRAGYRYSKTFSVTYTGSEPLEYEAQGLPQGLSINPATGEITGVPAAAGGPYTITVTVKEASGGTPLTNSTTYKLTVTDTSGGGNGNGGGSGGNNGGSGGGGNGGSTEKPAPKTQLPASAFSWDGERTLTINQEGITALGLTKVLWDGAELTRGTDYTVHQGSVIIRFSEDFISAQAPGVHTVKVEFLNHTGETTIKLTTDTGTTNTGTDTHNPSTGGDTQNPQTGDYDPSPWWWLLALIPAAALTLYAAAQLWRRLRRTEG